MKTCDAFNVFSTTAITGLTAQNTKGVSKVSETSPEMLRAQLDAVLEDIGTDSLKTGMVPSVPLAQEVARAVTKYGVKNLVVDPVMVSTSGCLLMDPSQGETYHAIERTIELTVSHIFSYSLTLLFPTL